MRQPIHACYPGSFDPVTLGHLDLIERASSLFDRLTVAVGHNTAKDPVFSVERRLELVRGETSRFDNVEVEAFQGLAVDFCRAHGASVILRGLRTVSDFETEYQMALTNRSIAKEIETVFVMPAEQYAFTSSRLIKEIVRSGGSVSRFVSPAVEEALAERLRGQDGP